MSAAVETVGSVLWVQRGTPPVMAMAHRHDDLEINIVFDGHLDYLFGGEHLRIVAGQVVLFWAATAHRLVEPSDAPPAGDIGWVHVPLPDVLAWNLPEQDLGRVLQGRPLIASIDEAGRDLGTMLETWERELATPDTAASTMLEVHAVVRRLLRSSGAQAAATSDTTSRVTAMAQYAMTHFRENLSVSDIAAAAQLNPTYAMTLFRRVMGSTVGEYLTRVRVAEAQRLLLTTRMTMSEITFAAGFGSQSALYTHFTRACGVPPGQYRVDLRQSSR